MYDKSEAEQLEKLHEHMGHLLRIIPELSAYFGIFGQLGLVKQIQANIKLLIEAGVFEKRP